VIQVADPRRRITVAPDLAGNAPYRREWLVANGLGGYASGTVAGIPTRRYHGYLIAALPNPAGRVMMLNSIITQLRFPDGRRYDLGWVPAPVSANQAIELVEFELELGLPVWRFRGQGVTVERRIVLSYSHNTATIRYRLLDGGPVRLELRPGFQFRGHDEPVSTMVPPAYPLQALGSRIELLAPAPLPSLHLDLAGHRTSFVIEPRSVPDLAYETEERRGYAWRGQLYSPGRFRVDLAPGAEAALTASTEPWDTIAAMTSNESIEAEHERRRARAAARRPSSCSRPTSS
jgi:predicted glycogen debranching enzyme